LQEFGGYNINPLKIIILLWQFGIFIGFFLESSERNYPRIFWLCTSLCGFFIFHEPVTTSNQSQIVIEQVRISRGGSKSDSSSFVTPTKEKRVQLKTAQNNFANNLESSGLSKDHDQLSQISQEIEIKTRLRRAQPLYSSEVLGDSYQYEGKQLERKADHLKDFGISIEGRTVEEKAMEYKDFVERLLSKSNLVISEDGKLNKIEPTINIGDPESLGIVAFENNPLYENHH
jgi:hypothetical protein